LISTPNCFFIKKPYSRNKRTWILWRISTVVKKVSNKFTFFQRYSSCPATIFTINLKCEEKVTKQVALLSAVTLTSQILFTTFFGALELLMAIPLAVVAKTWIEKDLFQDVLDKWDNTSFY
jgi:hypothetical protein